MKRTLINRCKYKTKTKQKKKSHINQMGPVHRMIKDVDKHNERLEESRLALLRSEAEYCAKYWHKDIFELINRSGWSKKFAKNYEAIDWSK